MGAGLGMLNEDDFTLGPHNKLKKRPTNAQLAAMMFEEDGPDEEA